MQMRNSQSNSASNSADVSVHNGGNDKKSVDSGNYHKKGDHKNGDHKSGDKISHSGNVSSRRFSIKFYQRHQQLAMVGLQLQMITHRPMTHTTQQL